MISKTKISKRTKKKTNPDLVETLLKLKKINPEIASILSSPTRKRTEKNLKEINQLKSETIIVPGKVLSIGNIKKKKKIIALSFSESAKEKLKKARCEISTFKEVLEKNPNKKLEGEILK